MAVSAALCSPTYEDVHTVEWPSVNNGVSRLQQSWQGLRDDIVSIGDQYFNHGKEAAILEPKLCDLWHEILCAAKAAPAISSELDLLVTLILEARELDFLDRENPLNALDKNQDEAILPNGQ